MSSTHSAPPVHRQALHRFAVLTAGATFLLILAGALVTSNDAGLSVPDWPLSHGSLMPEMVGGVFYEHGHRLVAATVGVLTLVLCLLLWKWETRRWVLFLGRWALLAVIAQALLGGTAVLYLLPPAVSVFHACLGQIFFCLTVALALVTSRWWIHSQAVHWAGFRPTGNYGGKSFRLVLATSLAVFLQLILGATLRHSGTVRGTKGAELGTLALTPHLAGAVLVAVLSLVTWNLLSRDVFQNRIRRLSVALVILLGSQMVLGVGALFVRLQAPQRVQPVTGQVLITTAHVGTGALMLALGLILTLILTRSQVLSGAAEGTSSEGAFPS